MRTKIAHVFANVALESRGIKFADSLKENGYAVVEILKPKEESYWKFVRKAFFRLIKKDIKIVHAHRISGYVPAIFAKILKPRLRIIYDKHDIHPYDVVFDRLAFFSNWVLVASELHLRRIRKFKKKSFVVHNYSNFKPIDKKTIGYVRKEIGLKKGELFLLFQGSIVKEYGLRLLVEALPEIDKKIKIVLLGWIKDQEYWDNLKNKFMGRVVYLGARKYREMNKYVGSADIGVVLFEKSRLTDFGNPAKLFEFICCKIPVVVTDVLSIAPYVRKYKNGLIANNNKELAEAINKLLDKKVRDRFSRASPNLRWDDDVKKYLKLIEELK